MKGLPEKESVFGQSPKISLLSNHFAIELTNDQIPQHLQTSPLPRAFAINELGAILQRTPTLLVSMLILDVLGAGPDWLLEVSEESTAPEGAAVAVDGGVGGLADEAEFAEVGVVGEVGGDVLGCLGGQEG